MRKEVILAVIIGVLLGGVILYGINLANTSSKINSGNEKTEESSKETISPESKQTNQISIIFPQDHSVVTDAQLTLKGTSKPNSNIAIVTESDDIITTADANGGFSSVINLITGENIITITSVDGKQATASSSISIIRAAALPE